MIEAVATALAAATPAFDVLGARRGGAIPLVAVSAIAGVALVLAFGVLSNQERLAALRRRARGALLGIRVFGDDPRVLARLFGEILQRNGEILARSLGPLLVLTPFVFVVLVQLDLRHEARPIRDGESVTVDVALAPGVDLGSIDLEPTEGVLVEAGPVRIPALREASWRVRPTAPGSRTLRWNVGGETVEKTLVVGEESAAVARERHRGDRLASWLHPGERPLPESSPVLTVRVGYEPFREGVAGTGLSWLTLFVIVSLLAGFATAWLRGVTF